MGGWEMRAILSGSISFGLVNIPIKLYSASEDQGLDLTMLHKKDKSPIRYAKICRSEEIEIPYSEVIKGYEYQKGDYLTLSDKDFDAVRVLPSKNIEIIQFSDQSDVDLRFFEKPYYLEPEKGADSAYALLREALNKSKKIAIAKFILRNRSNIAVIKPIGDVLVLERIRFQSEVRSFSTLRLPGSKMTKKKEMEMALILIDQWTDKFNPEAFVDTYQEELEKIISAKIEGKKPAVKGKHREPTKVKNLMDALKASLKKTKPAKKKAA